MKIAFVLILLFCALPVFAEFGILQDGLVLNLDQSDPRSYGDTQNWYDISGFNHHGTQSPGVYEPSLVGADALSGYTRYFIQDYMTVADNNDLDFSTDVDFTFAVWMNTDASPGGTYPGYFTRRDSFLVWMAMHNDGGANDDKVRFADGTNTVFSANTYTDAAWHLLVGVADRDTDSYLYIDGALIDNAGAASNGNDLSMAEDWHIAAGENSSKNPVHWLYGHISSIRVWRKALTAAEVQLLYNKERKMYSK